MRDGHERVELGAGGAGGDGRPRLLDALGDARRRLGDVERRAGVEQDDVEVRARGAVEDLAHVAGVLGGVAAAQVVERRAAQAELLGRDLVVHVEALPGEHLDDGGGAGRRDLVEPVVAVHDQVAVVAHQPHRLGDALDVARVGDADELVSGAGRVGQRSDEVERRRHADLAAHRRHVLHGEVVARREHEADARLGDAAAHLGRGDVDGDAQRLEHVGAAALAGGRAVAVLGHGDAGAGGDDGGGGRDVEGPGVVAAGAAGVEDHVGVHLDLLGQRAHGARHADDLLGGLALDAQGAEEGGRLRVAGAAAHDLEQHVAGLVLAEVLARRQALQRRAQDVIRHG